VALAEEGWTKGAIAEAVAREYLEPMMSDAGADCLVLGCTHFPTLQETIRKVVGSGVRIVDSAKTTAETVREELDARGLRAPSGSIPRIRLLATDAPDRFLRIAERFFPRELLPDRIELVDL
jgi:glutamate racemase